MKEQIEKQISDIIQFTCEYWYPLYEKSEKDCQKGLVTPATPKIIWDIIQKRSRYVEELKLNL